MRSNWLKRIASLAAFAAAAAFVGSYSLDLWAKRRVAYFESAFSEAMGRPVTIGGAGFDPLYGFYFDHFQLKERKTAPRPLSIERLEAHIRLAVFPEPTVRVQKLVLLRPRIGIDVHPQDLFRSQLWLKRVPTLETRIGHLKFEAKLDSVEAYDGRISLFSPNGVRQDFENVRFFAGKRWHAPQTLSFEGRVAGKPEARFKIDCSIRPNAQGMLESEARTEFRHFTTAYLSPFLAGRFHFPDRNLTGSLKVSIDAHGIVDVTGFLSLPQTERRGWSLWSRKPFEVRLRLTGRRALEQLVFDEFTLRASGITVSGNASAVWKKGRESWQAQLSAHHVPVDRLPHAWTRPWRFESGVVDFAVRATGTPDGYEPDTVLSLTNVGARNDASKIRIDRATGTLRVVGERLEMRNLWLFYNETPLRLSGVSILGEGGRLAVEGQTFPGQLPALKQKNAMNVAFRLAAKKSAGGWSGALRTSVETGADRGPGEQRSQTWTLSLRGWNLDRPVDDRLRASVRHVLVRADGTPVAPFRGPFRLDDVRMDLALTPSNLVLALRDGRFDGGRMAGFLSCDDSMTWQAWLKLREVDAGVLARRLGVDPPVRGRLQAAVQGRGQGAGSSVFGHFRIDDGQIGPSGALRELAAQTGIRSLDPVRFDRLSGRLRAEGGTLYLEDWKLEGRDLGFTGDARVRDGAMSGRMTARFPLRVVNASSSLLWLANFVGEREAIDFDFRIAGRLERPRVHWLAGTFREKIQKRLAPWMRDEFSRQIQKRFLEKSPAVTA